MYLLATLEVVGIALVLVGICFVIFLSVMAYHLISTKEDTLKFLLIVVAFFIFLCGFPIVTIFLKPLTLVYFDLSNNWANALGWVFHCLSVSLGVVIGLMKRYDLMA